MVKFVLELVAPGTDILSAKANGELATRSGTSMAGAFLSGVAALLFEARPASTPNEVAQALLAKPLFIKILLEEDLAAICLV